MAPPLMKHWPLLLVWLVPLVVVFTSLLTVVVSSSATTAIMIQQPTPVTDVPRIVSTVADKAHEWQYNVSLDAKICLLEQILSNTIEYSHEWTTLAYKSRGIHPTNPHHGCGRADVSIASVATFATYLNGLIVSLQHCRRTTHDGMMPPPPKNIRRTSQGRNVIVTLWPIGILQNLEAVGLRGELVVLQQETVEEEQQLQLSYDEATTSVGGGGIAGILGAGNIDAPIELLCQMFLKGRVCVFKPNPVSQGQAAVLSKILFPLVERGYLDFCFDDGNGTDVGAALVSNPQLDEVVLTGSTMTYEKIKPVCNGTPICAELGGVNPWIVVPGRQWNDKTIDSHARHLAFARVANNGHTCAAPQVILVPKDWTWRRQFLDRLTFWLGQYAGSPPFYPGSEETHALFASLPNAQVIRGEMEDSFDRQQRPILIPDVVVDNEEQNPVFRKEAFCPVLAEVPLDVPHAEDDTMGYLRTAVDFAKRQCFGSLTANILIPDEEIKANEQELDDVIADMPFGVVGVNLWPAYAHSMPMLVWGAPPGYSESGTGFIGNAFLYKNPQKAVLRAPFRWIGRRALTVMSPTKSELVFSRLAKYRARPNVVTQAMLFTALFLGA